MESITEELSLYRMTIDCETMTEHMSRGVSIAELTEHLKSKKIYDETKIRIKSFRTKIGIYIILRRIVNAIWDTYSKKNREYLK